MLQQRSCYQAQCDGCGRGAAEVRLSMSEAILDAANVGWRFVDGKHYCKVCQEAPQREIVAALHR